MYFNIDKSGLNSLQLTDKHQPPVLNIKIFFFKWFELHVCLLNTISLGLKFIGYWSVEFSTSVLRIGPAVKQEAGIVTLPG